MRLECLVVTTEVTSEQYENLTLSEPEFAIGSETTRSENSRRNPTVANMPAIWYRFNVKYDKNSRNET